MYYDAIHDVDGNEYYTDDMILLCCIDLTAGDVCAYLNPRTLSIVLTVTVPDCDGYGGCGAEVDTCEIVQFSDLQKAMLLYSANRRGSNVMGE